MQKHLTDPPTLAELEAAAQQICDAIQNAPNSPEMRLEAREAFYIKYGFYDSVQYGYGRSEIDFMKWEKGRGVLNAATDPVPGSAWWRDVNITFIYYSTLGALIFESGQAYTGVPEPAVWWVNYLVNPGPKTWYMAHNCSIAWAYVQCTTQALAETTYEQMFMNEVLSRLFYAEAMMEGQQYAFGELGELLANPLLPSVDIMVHLPDFYPDDYPLTQADIAHVMHIGEGVEMDLDRLLDEVLISPQMENLFTFISGLLNVPELLNFVVAGKIVYPNLSLPKSAQVK